MALERKGQRALALVEVTRRRGESITVPVPVVVEWWRGQRGPVAHLLEAFDIEPLGTELARVAGVALGEVGKGPSVTDAVVMASAAQRGDIVLTSDLKDMAKLQSVFSAVRILRA